MREYAIINPTREELKGNIASAALDSTPLLITALERLDELTARRRQAETVDLQLEIDSIHLRDGGFVIAHEVPSGAFARIEFTNDATLLFLVDDDDFEPATTTP